MCPHMHINRNTMAIENHIKKPKYVDDERFLSSQGERKGGGWQDKKTERQQMYCKWLGNQSNIQGQTIVKCKGLRRGGMSVWTTLLLPKKEYLKKWKFSGIELLLSSCNNKFASEQQSINSMPISQTKLSICWKVKEKWTT